MAVNRSLHVTARTLLFGETRDEADKAVAALEAAQEAAEAALNGEDEKPACEPGGADGAAAEGAEAGGAPRRSTELTTTSSATSTELGAPPAADAQTEALGDDALGGGAPAEGAAPASGDAPAAPATCKGSPADR